MKWYKNYDNNNNDQWEASAPYTDELGSPLFNYRISKRLFGNNIEFYETSDSDIISLTPRIWKTLREAKAELKQEYENIVDHYKIDQTVDIKYA